MHPTHNTLSENIRAQSVELLNKHLAAAIDLHAQVKQAHWNVRGPSFIAIHELFDKVSGEVENYSDLIAERAGGLGGTAYGTVQVAAERSFLVPYPHERPSAKPQPSEMQTPLICSPKSRGASTISYGSSNPTSSPKNDRATSRWISPRPRGNGSKVLSVTACISYQLSAVHIGACVSRRAGLRERFVMAVNESTVDAK